MKKKHLFWIIPIVLIIGMLVGLFFGFTGGVEFLDRGELLIEATCEMSMDTLTYVVNNNKDCAILATGYAQKHQDKINDALMGVEPEEPRTPVVLVR